MEPNKTALELRQVSKTYRSESGSLIRALEAVNLTVGQGDFAALVGPTGCGKTTLLNIIAGLLSPDSGKVILAEGLQPGKNMPCVFQHYNLFPWRTLLHNVTFGLQMSGIKRRERNDIARDLLGKVGLADFQSAYPHELSGGMRQRGAIAQALAIKPKLLLMDEPFGALDDFTRKELQQTLIDLWQDSSITVLFITHNINEAVTMADQVIVLAERPGQVTKQLKVELPRPRHALSKEFTELLVELRQSSRTICDPIDIG